MPFRPKHWKPPVEPIKGDVYQAHKGEIVVSVDKISKDTDDLSLVRDTLTLDDPMYVYLFLEEPLMDMFWAQGDSCPWPGDMVTEARVGDGEWAVLKDGGYNPESFENYMMFRLAFNLTDDVGLQDIPGARHVFNLELIPQMQVGANELTFRTTASCKTKTGEDPDAFIEVAMGTVTINLEKGDKLDYWMEKGPKPPVREDRPALAGDEARYRAAYTKLGEDILFLQIASDDWFIERHEYTGIPLRRKRWVTLAVRDDDGGCGYSEGLVTQEHLYDDEWAEDEYQIWRRNDLVCETIPGQ